MAHTIKDILALENRFVVDYEDGSVTCTWVHHNHAAVLGLHSDTEQAFGVWSDQVMLFDTAWSNRHASAYMLYDLSQLTDMQVLLGAQDILNTAISAAGYYGVVLPSASISGAVQPFFQPYRRASQRQDLVRQVFYSNQGALIWLVQAL